MAPPLKLDAYYHGKPCKHGHDGLRYRRSHACVACSDARVRARDERTREQDRAVYGRIMADPDRRKKKSDTAAAWKRSNPRHRMLFNARMNAKRRGVPCTITIDDIIIPDYCPVLGIPLRVDLPEGKATHCPNSTSLDRIIPSLGYVPGNVQVISNRANLLKNDGTAEEHRLIAEYIKARTGR